MFNKETLNHLISNLNTIQTIFMNYGYKEPAIFEPLSFSDSKKLNFVASPQRQETINLFDISKMELELAKLLHCKVQFFPENRINEESKEFVTNSKVLLTKENSNKIKLFFRDVLKIKDDSPVNTSLFANQQQSHKKQQEQENRDVTPMDIVDYLKKDEAIWHAIGKSPKILEDAASLLKLQDNKLDF